MTSPSNLSEGSCFSLLKYLSARIVIKFRTGGLPNSNLSFFCGLPEYFAKFIMNLFKWQFINARVF